MRVILTPRFRSMLKKLAKIYRIANVDVEALVDQLEAGETPGVLLQGVGGREVCKVRLPNSSARIGKSGGFRVQYHAGDEPVSLFLVWSVTQIDDLPLSLTPQVLEEEVFN